MESDITMIATPAEMDDFFEENAVCSVRYFKQNDAGVYYVKIRHSERKQKLYGTYTIPQLISVLTSKPVTAKQLQARIRQTEEALYREHVKNVEMFSLVGWGAGMRRVKAGHIAPNYSHGHLSKSA